MPRRPSRCAPIAVAVPALAFRISLSRRCDEAMAKLFWITSVGARVRTI